MKKLPKNIKLFTEVINRNIAKLIEAAIPDQELKSDICQTVLANLQLASLKILDRSEKSDVICGAISSINDLVQEYNQVTSDASDGGELVTKEELSRIFHLSDKLIAKINQINKYCFSKLRCDHFCMNCDNKIKCGIYDT